MLSEFLDLYASNRWATEQTLRAASELSQADFARPLGGSFPSLGDTLRHVVNHATYHRGQTTTLIRQLGGTPATSDYFTYCLLRDAGKLS